MKVGGKRDVFKKVTGTRKNTLKLLMGMKTSTIYRGKPSEDVSANSGCNVESSLKSKPSPDMWKDVRERGGRKKVDITRGRKGGCE